MMNVTFLFLYNYAVKYIISAILIFIVLCSVSGSQEREVVATVDSSPIYLDEITTGQVVQQGEIKFVEPDVKPDQGGIEAQILLLRSLIADKILRTEIRNRAISPPGEVVQKEVDAYAERQWRALFPNEEKKKEVLKRMQFTGLKILEGLTLWNKDKAKGDRFAETNLMPLGMTPEAWAFYTDHADDPEIIGKLRKWEDIDTMSNEEIKEFLFLTKSKEHINNIKYLLSKEILKNQVTEESKPGPEDTKRLYDLIWNTERMDIVIIPEGAPELKELYSLERSKRPSALPEKFKSKLIRLPRSEKIKARGKNPNLKELMILASNTDSLEPGTISSVINRPSEKNGPGSFVIFIYDREPKAKPSRADEKTLTELTNRLGDFNRDVQFSIWLQSEIRLRTEILIPEYEKALSY